MLRFPLFTTNSYPINVESKSGIGKIARQTASECRNAETGHNGKNVENAEFIYKSTRKCLYSPISDLSCQCAPKSLCDLIPYESSQDFRIERMLNYYKINHLNAQIDDQILIDLLKEDEQLKRNNKRINEFSGNNLHSFEWNGQNYIALAHSTKIEIYSLIMNEFMVKVDKLVQFYEFDLPITQITSRKEKGSKALLVRTMKGIHEINLVEKAVNSTVEFGSEPRHLAVNYHMPSDSCVLVGENQLFSWNLKKERYIAV
jgi:hypothetical protein